VAVPVIVGARGRIPVGALTDRFGGRVMFPVVSFTAIISALFLGLAGYRSLAGLLAGGFFLGVAGASFAVGVPFVNGWFPAERRGLAIGIFGMGMGMGHRDQRAHHGQSHRPLGHARAVPNRRGGPGGL
jgi:NNP family nitrate/nitrite transporter-like MFS transporter